MSIKNIYDQFSIYLLVPGTTACLEFEVIRGYQNIFEVCFEGETMMFVIKRETSWESLTGPDSESDSYEVVAAIQQHFEVMKLLRALH